MSEGTVRKGSELEPVSYKKDRIAVVYGKQDYMWQVWGPKKVHTRKQTFTTNYAKKSSTWWLWEVKCTATLGKHQLLKNTQHSWAWIKHNGSRKKKHVDISLSCNAFETSWPPYRLDLSLYITQNSKILVNRQTCRTTYLRIHVLVWTALEILGIKMSAFSRVR